MSRSLFVFLVFCLLGLFSVDAFRNFNNRVPDNYKGDPCDKMCPRREGWDKCEIVKAGRQVSVKCIDNRPDPPRRG